MDHPAKSLAAAAAKLAAELPSELVEAAAEVLLASADLEAARRGIAERIAHAQYRQAIDGFLSRCAGAAPFPPVTVAVSLPPVAIAASLLAAAAAEQSIRARQEVEVVWTGPHSEAIAFRRTEQVILQVLDSATSRITLVSYAVYAIPRVRAALVRAAQRGVRIQVILETPDRLSGQNEYNTLSALGAEVAACASVYYWPEGKRPRDGAKAGILHAKCLVADSRWLFVSSANLTEYAFSINMELGVLMTGGRLPQQVEALFDSLVAEGELIPI